MTFLLKTAAATRLASLIGAAVFFFRAFAQTLVLDPSTLKFVPIPVQPPNTTQLTVMSDGKPVGARAAINLVPGAGIVSFLSDTGSTINIQQALDTSFAETRSNLQSGSDLNCISASGPAYSCSMMPTLGQYTTGMVVHWRPGAIATGVLTLNIDTLGDKPLKAPDGLTDPTGIVPGQMYQLWFDGTLFRLLSAPSSGPVVPPSQILPPAGSANGLVLTTKNGVWVPSLPSGIPLFGHAPFQPPPAIAVPQGDGTWLCGSKPILNSYPGLTINPWSIVAVVDRLEQHAWSDPAVDDWSFPPPLNKDGLAILRPTLNASAWKPTSVVVCHYALQ